MNNQNKITWEVNIWTKLVISNKQICKTYKVKWDSSIIDNLFNIFRNLGQTFEGAPISLDALQAIQWIHRIGAITVIIYFSYLSFALMKYKQLRFESILLLCTDSLFRLF